MCRSVRSRAQRAQASLSVLPLQRRLKRASWTVFGLTVWARKSPYDAESGPSFSTSVEAAGHQQPGIILSPHWSQRKERLLRNPIAWQQQYEPFGKRKKRFRQILP